MCSISDLPIELIELIIDFTLFPIGESLKNALNLALVSRTWTIYSRSHLELSLDESRVRFQKLRAFTELCRHPLSTLKLVGALFLSNVGNTRVSLLRSPLHHTAVNTFLSRRFHTRGGPILESVFTQLKKLTLDRVGWWTLNNIARDSVCNGFRSVTELHLRHVSFSDIQELQVLICSFPLLERLHLTLQQPSASYSVVKNPTSLQLPKRLYAIDITTVDQATFQGLSIITPCPSLRQFCWRSNVFYELEDECRNVGEFLEATGSSLVELSLIFNVDMLSNDIRIRQPTNKVAIQQFMRFHDCVDLTKNLSLQRVTLDIRPDPYLVLFLQYAIRNEQALSVQSLYIPFLENVIFSLNPRILSNEGLTQNDLDIALQQPALANLRRLEFGVQGFFPRQSVTEKIAQVLSGLMERPMLLLPNQDDCAAGINFL
ncbi:hypothetical protein DFH05DRAFT_930862 [Lentinula detonsa]|uniref:F-box domain-containing protein n=1 Tax=Lentinula detonsa TaxID=2804962 RepID=A0A9W8P3N6_9AGAR|nr:hypothetical protein DFH05DRAFT_930862 [Lentinula detonsa]